MNSTLLVVFFVSFCNKIGAISVMNITTKTDKHAKEIKQNIYDNFKATNETDVLPQTNATREMQKITNETKTGVHEEIEATNASDIESLSKQVRYLLESDRKHKTEIEELKIQLKLQKEQYAKLEEIVRKLANDVQANSTKTESSKILADLHTLPETSVTFSSLRQRKRRSTPDGPVAFFVKLVKHMEHAGLNQPVVFDTVVTNFGGGYNSITGSFVAPVAGVYVFSTSLFTLYKISFHANFVKNGEPVTQMYAAGAESSHDTSSQTIILHLQENDEVCVRHNDADRTIHGYNYSIFSGFLLTEF